MAKTIKNWAFNHSTCRRIFPVHLMCSRVDNCCCSIAIFVEKKLRKHDKVVFSYWKKALKNRNSHVTAARFTHMIRLAPPPWNSQKFFKVILSINLVTTSREPPITTSLKFNLFLIFSRLYGSFVAIDSITDDATKYRAHWSSIGRHFFWSQRIFEVFFRKSWRQSIKFPFGCRLCTRHDNDDVGNSLAWIEKKIGKVFQLKIQYQQHPSSLHQKKRSINWKQENFTSFNWSFSDSSRYLGQSMVVSWQMSIGKYDVLEWQINNEINTVANIDFHSIQFRALADLKFHKSSVFWFYW